MSAESFLKRLKDEELIDEAVIAKLRQQIGRAGAPVPAQQVAGLLVDKGHLTKFQAKKLLEGLEPAGSTESGDELGLAQESTPKKTDKAKTAAGPPPAPEKRWKGKTPPPAAKKEKKPASSKPAPASPKPAPAAKDTGGLQPVGSDDLQPISGGDLQPLGMDEGLTPLGVFGADPMMGAVPMEGQAGMLAPAGQPQPAAPQKPLFRGKKFRENQWDSPWLLIGGGLLILLLLLGGWLVFVLTKGDANEMFEAGDKSYRQESYSDAIDKFDTFLLKFPGRPLL